MGLPWGAVPAQAPLYPASLGGPGGDIRRVSPESTRNRYIRACYGSIMTRKGKGKGGARGRSVGGVSTALALDSLFEMLLGQNSLNVGSPVQQLGMAPAFVKGGDYSGALDHVQSAAQSAVANVPAAALPALGAIVWKKLAPKVGATRILVFKVGRTRVRPFG